MIKFSIAKLSVKSSSRVGGIAADTQIPGNCTKAIVNVSRVESSNSGSKIEALEVELGFEVLYATASVTPHRSHCARNIERGPCDKHVDFQWGRWRQFRSGWGCP